ncbi:MAG: hypothetical protein RLZ37_291 [Actinomycetota bacterium]|jgi:hypothetical protein
MSTVALVANLAATLVMVGVIWFVQHVHYPLLAIFNVESAPQVALEHQRRTGHVVALPMAVEGVSTLALLVVRPDGVSVIWPWIGAGLLAIALGSTLFLSVPLHARMASSPQADTGRRLVSTNWPRTVAWTLRGIVGIIMIAQAIGGSA